MATRLLRLAWAFPFVRVMASRRTIVVLYHGIPVGGDGNLAAHVFEQHVRFLKRHFEFVSPDDTECARRPYDKVRILLTFDDGFRNNADVVAPILRHHHVPAMFFVSSRHATPGKYLWFSYLNALESGFPRKGFSFRGIFFDMSGRERVRSVRRLRDLLLGLTPHPAAMYDAIEEELPRLEDFVSESDLCDSYAGMTREQVAALAADPLFSIGVHTVDHPFLTKCRPDEALRQIQANRAWLQAACAGSCDAIAYPGGDYSPELVTVCRQVGFTRGYAVSPRTGGTSRFELSRIGIYSGSLDVLAFKIQWGNVMRGLGIPVG